MFLININISLFSETNLFRFLVYHFLVLYIKISVDK